MADPILAFRTVTEMFLVRYSLVAGVLTPSPIAIPMNPANITLAHGMSNQDLRQTSATGTDQVVYTYLQESTPELSIEFGATTPEIEATLINRIAATEVDAVGWVYFTAVANKTSIAAKSAGEFGHEVAAQTVQSKALVYYIDPLTKLAKPLTIVASAPTGDQIVIGANLALTLSSALAATGANIYGWVPTVTFANATKIGSTSPVLYSAFIMGICFDETVRQLTCNRMSWMPGGNFDKAPTRSLSFRVLPDTTDTTGLGYTIRYLRGTVPAQQ